MTKNLRIYKIAAAITLLVSFFLPMSSCSYTVPLELGVGETAPDSGEVTPEQRTVIMYAREYVDLRETGSWLNLFGFTWPIFLILLQFRYGGRRALLLLPLAGMCLSMLSGCVIYAWADVGKPLFGAYLGGVAVLALFTIYTVELVVGIREGNN